MGDKREMTANYRLRKSSVKKGKKAIVPLIIALVMVFGFFKAAYTFVKMRVQKASLNSEIASLKEDNAKLSGKMANIAADEEFVSKTAREQLGLVKDGETVFILVDK
ncbi:MAG: septum formation initiator family protein [Candidatus Goldbacteria bacterium]|jgi:cell division protein FtsB|nr:septum formation initiator family protein [Candidatus Goldiibacteriota bacterium]PKL92320.1 MAG: hypothetical protein CVV21_03130 [Candidatus Goldiibacteriota bacterium HGW-Goldbacteria-1]